MQRVTIDIPDNKVPFFMELIHQLGFDAVKPLPDEQQEFVADLKHSPKQVKAHQNSMTKAQQKEFEKRYNYAINHIEEGKTWDEIEAKLLSQ